MIARRSVWPRPEIQQLAEQFVMVADEVHRLQSGRDTECRWFQEIAEQGHYAGRTQPTATRQGIYMAAPSGEFLGSLNSNDWRRVAEAMREALRRWEALDPSERLTTAEQLEHEVSIRRKEDHYPEGGLVLRVYSRDLPRGSESTEGWRASAWNQDLAWFRENELPYFIPEELREGASVPLPSPVVERLARAHLVDNVRGQTPPYRSDDVQQAELEATVTRIDGEVVALKLHGAVRTVADGRWSVQGFRDMHDPENRQRGIDVALLGRAKFDRAAGRFVQFDLVAVGTRWGGTQYNGRHDDLDPAPIGYVFTLAGDTPTDRVGPELFYAYGW